MRFAYLALVSATLFSTCVQAHADTPAIAVSASTPQEQIDALFAHWNRKDIPGCAVGVIQDGKLVYRRGFGMADLEHDSPILPTTPFHVASMSKQFTAFAIHLLAQDGKLSLNDDIRKYLPELHDFGHTITISHLLHHTSGLRDQWGLLGLAGWRLDDVITEDDILGLLARQTALNFVPGKEELYSNTGYTLLGMIVKRVSGKPLPVFAQERIFAPLGMSHTQFHDTYGTLVQGRALSYDPLPRGGYQYVALSYSNVGATSLFTTVEDLALWDQNFYDGKVGGKALIAAMQTRGELSNGRTIDYASGLMMGSYRGLNTVEHGGADAGYRSNLLRFPEQHFSVVILANAGDFDTGRFSRKVADIYLGKRMKSAPADIAKPAKTWTEVAVDPAHLDALVGEYALSQQFSIVFTKENGVLMAQATGQPKFPLAAADERTFFLKVVDAQFTFDPPGKDGVVASGALHQNGRDVPARRVVRTSLSPAALRAFEGEYYSDELHVLYTIGHRGDQLTLSYPRGQMTLTPISAKAFGAEYPIGRVQFDCRADAQCSGMNVSNGRVRKLQFSRVTLAAAAAPAVADQDSAPPFATEAMYLRGSMNDWGLRDKLQAAGAQRYAATVALEKGHYEFKVGSDDFEVIDLGAAPHEEAATLSQARKVETKGGNFSVDVPKAASYRFVLDASDQHAPTITVSEAAAAL